MSYTELIRKANSNAYKERKKRQNLKIANNRKKPLKDCLNSRFQLNPDCYIEVALPVPVFGTFIYSVPEDLKSDIKIGVPVFVSFGRRNLTGYVTGFSKLAPKGVKPIKEIVSPEPLFTACLLKVLSWLSNYYITPIGLIIRTYISPQQGIREKIIVHSKEGSVERIKGNTQAFAIYQEIKGRPLSRNYIRRKFKDSLAAYNLLLKNNLIYETKEKKYPAKSISPEGLRLAKPFKKGLLEKLEHTAPIQSKIVQFLFSANYGIEKRDIYAKFGNVYSSIKALKEKEIVESFAIPFSQKIPALPHKISKKPQLTHNQQEAVKKIVDAMEKRDYQTFLLFGITGSGKTEIYLRTVEKVLNQGKGAIVLVPEISLTAQTVEAFKERFGETVVIYHSRLAKKERVEVWKGINEGKYRVIIGARFAVFAPVKKLGIIIVDEEHESTYKQKGKEPPYSARDTAVLRAKIQNAVCILGSATPSVESFYNAKNGKYTLISLPKRIDERELPPVEIVDMKKEKDFLLSEILFEKIDKTIKKNEQIILLINRRGFSHFLLCRDCGFSPRCPFCDLTLTYHKKEVVLKCHYCGYEENLPRTCPKCGSSRFFYAGTGTQRVEQYLEKKFDKLKIMRMDLDTMKKKWAHMESFFRFRRGKANVLLGTQMVAKGFDLPKVTLVGVISADTVLNFPDFRAEERTFQLLTQVAGRTGRGILGGEVVIQTHSPEHYAVKDAQFHNYEKFYKQEIVIRKELNYPPFSRFARIILSSTDLKKLKHTSNELGKKLLENTKTKSPKIQILGPVPCPLPKLRGRYRFHFLLKSKKPFLLQKLLLPFKKNYRICGVNIFYDIDPADMM